MYKKLQDHLAAYTPHPLGNHYQAAVLLPLIDIDGAPHLLYEVRSHNVSQAGDSSFPGGALEEGETFAQAAIRETCEELGLAPEAIVLLGEIDYIVTDASIIRAFVGHLPGIGLADLRPNLEVAEVYTLPISYLQAHPPTYYQSMVVHEHPADFPYERIPGGKNYPWGKQAHPIPFYEINDHALWGFTARLTHRFLQLWTSRMTT